MTEDQYDLAWRAFRAGFYASGEGWNGEYPHETDATESASFFSAFCEWFYDQ